MKFDSIRQRNEENNNSKMSFLSSGKITQQIVIFEGEVEDERLKKEKMRWRK